MLQLLVRQYESTLDIVMKKFRTQTSIIHDKKYREQSELEVSLEQERVSCYLFQWWKSPILTNAQSTLYQRRRMLD